MKTKFYLILLCTIYINTASASNGVIEINHTCATELGCFDGDSLGYPVSITGTAGKSYRLTSDLIIPDENTHGIQIQSNDLSIDLNGFAIIRSGCEATTNDCTAQTGTGNGISMSLTAYKGLSVKNGSIIGMGRHGISQISENGNFDNLNVRWNREFGILVGSNSVISNSIISYNGTAGISLRGGSVANNNTVSHNGSTGISGSLGPSIITNNVAHNNGSNGISSQSGGLVKNNIVYENIADGISCLSSQAISNSIYDNGDDGISTSNTCHARDNLIRNNAGYGIRFPGGGSISVISGNIIIGNATGTILNINNYQLENNFCETNDVCP